MTRAAALVLLLGACGGDDGAGVDGYETVFADDFSAGLVRWDGAEACGIDTAFGRPAPAVTGRCQMRGFEPASFDGQRAIASLDFASRDHQSATLHLFISQSETTSFGDPVIALGVTSTGSVGIACPGTTTTVEDAGPGFHHADLRVGDTGIAAAIDGVPVCDGVGLRTLTGMYRIVLAFDSQSDGMLSVDNVQLFRER